MTTPPTQVMCEWMLSDMSQREWVQLPVALEKMLRKRLPNYNDTQIFDVIDQHSAFIIQLIRDRIEGVYHDGTSFTHEIDSEDPPYIRFSGEDVSSLLKKLKNIDPFDFEIVCSKLLESFGCTSEVTQRTNDGGIDFIAHGLDILPDAIGCPTHCKASVIGQAKRYGNKLIAEKSLREFVGASLLQRHVLRQGHKLTPLSPVLLAFWTTSEFDPNAWKYARNSGVWLLNGPTISTYLRQRALEDWVMSLPDEKKQIKNSQDDMAN